MKKGLSCFITLLLVICLLLSIAPAAFASSESEYVSQDTFWNWVAGNGGTFQKIIGYACKDVCTQSDDSYHHASSFVDEGPWPTKGRYTCICSYCGQTFTAYESDLQQSYGDYITTLPAAGYSSTGELRWRLSVNRFERPSNSTVVLGSTSCGTEYSVSIRTEGSGERTVYGYFDEFKAPVSGSYRLSAYFSRTSSVTIFLISFGFYYITCDTGGLSFTKGPTSISSQKSPLIFQDLGAFANDVIIPSSAHFGVALNSNGIGTFNGYWEFICTPLEDLSSNIYNITSRPTSITGNYGIIGDNGQITAVEDNSTIVNETNNTYYNPATGTTSPITDWSYNYADRSYTVTTESGDTVTVTYGDENITIKEGDTTYNVYYISPGSGSETPGPSPSPSPSPSPTPTPCAHDWQPGDTEPVLPTCTRDGSALYTCSICGETKTEVLPAPGHSWQVKQSVSTQYDESGTLIQEGYTLYECTVCQEQYKDTEGAGPPQPPSQEKESIWEKIGKLLGSIFGGFVGLIEAALGKVLDALTALCELLLDKLGAVVETILSVLDEVPKLFGGFLDFLSAVFPFLPPELMLLLTFGVIAIVVIGIIKALRR